jgi:hypothetical protein
MDVSNYDPLPELHRPDADTTLLFLSANDVKYTSEIDDKWYSAHLRAPANLSGYQRNGQGRPIYFRDEPVGVLGCTFRRQFCNANLPAGKQCPPFSGAWSHNATYPDEWNAKADHNRIAWAAKVLNLYTVDIDGIAKVMGAAALSSRNSLWHGLQGSLPRNQWQLDAERFHQTAMASMQRAYVDVAMGKFSDSKFARRPNNTQEKELCSGQVRIFARVEILFGRMLIRGSHRKYVQQTTHPSASSASSSRSPSEQ